MSTHDYNIANASGASVRSDLNNALAAILSNNSNASSPSTTAAYSIWADTNAGKLKIRNSSNDDWVDLINLDGTIARDLTFTGASANIVFDQSDNALEFADNAKATFGTGADLTISHDGSNSIINDAGTGELQLQRAGNTILTLNSSGVEIADPDGTCTVAIKGFEGGNANLSLKADEADDDGDTWLLSSTASDNSFHIYNDESGGNVSKFQILTGGHIGVGLTPQTSDVATNVSAGLIQTDANIDIRYAGTNSDPAGARYINFINTDTSLVANQPMGGLHFIGNDSSNPNRITSSILAEVSGSTGTGSHLLFTTNGELRAKIFSAGGLGIGNGSNGGVSGTLAHGGMLSIEHASGDLVHFSRTGSANDRVLTLQSGRATGSNVGNCVVLENSSGSTVGTIKAGASSTTFNTSSDYRLKENAVAISDGITRLKTLKPYRFNWKVDSTTTVDGFFAHEVTAVPEAVSGTKDEVITQAMIDSGDAPTGNVDDPIYQEIDQTKLVPLITAALQEAITKIETLETKVAALEAA